MYPIDSQLEIILELEKELDIQIPLISCADEEDMMTSYALDSQNKITQLLICQSRLSAKHLPLIGRLTSLQKLDLTYNQIEEIEGLDNLANLQTLGLNGNNIKEIQGLSNLTSLQELWLDDNQITKIQGLDNLTSIQKLDLFGNQIMDATPLKALLLNQKKANKKVLDISGSLDKKTPLTTPPIEVIENGSESFLEWVLSNG